MAGILLTVLAAACGSSGPPTAPGPIVIPPTDPGPGANPSPPTLGVTRILAFGDSMTEGTTSVTFTPFTLTAGLPQSYPFKLQTLLSARYTAQTITVANAGRAGEQAAQTSPSTHDRFSGALSEAKPQLLLLMEGANDLNNIPTGSTNVSPIVGAMEDMVRDALGRGVQVMLATIPPQRPGQKNTIQAALVPKYNSELKLMASKKGAMLVDVNALLPLSLIGQDGLHPTDAGYQMLAEIFMDAIKARYEEPTTARR
jgi:lysophospholipase L1-like esterase